MVQYIVNPTGTGRKIKVGGPTYNKLVKEGKISKNGKKPNGNGKKPNGNGKKPNGNGKTQGKQLRRVQKKCRKMSDVSKADLIDALRTLTKDELCKLIAQIPSTPKDASKRMQKKVDAYLAAVQADSHKNPRACDGKPMPKCFGVYCAKTGRYGCPSAGPDVIYAARHR